jgi:hypothetical protein
MVDMKKCIVASYDKRLMQAIDCQLGHPVVLCWKHPHFSGWVMLCCLRNLFLLVTVLHVYSVKVTATWFIPQTPPALDLYHIILNVVIIFTTQIPTPSISLAVRCQHHSESFSSHPSPFKLSFQFNCQYPSKCARRSHEPRALAQHSAARTPVA